jgi:hypothetical protein
MSGMIIPMSDFEIVRHNGEPDPLVECLQLLDDCKKIIAETRKNVDAIMESLGHGRR